MISEKGLKQQHINHKSANPTLLPSMLKPSLPIYNDSLKTDNK